MDMLVGEKPKDVVKEDVEKKEHVVAKKEPGVLSRWFGGLNLRSAAGSQAQSAREIPPAGTYTVGEARGEYVKVCYCLSTRQARLTRHFPAG